MRLPFVAAELKNIFIIYLQTKGSIYFFIYCTDFKFLILCIIQLSFCFFVSFYHPFLKLISSFPFILLEHSVYFTIIYLVMYLLEYNSCGRDRSLKLAYLVNAGYKLLHTLSSDGCMRLLF